MSSSQNVMRIDYVGTDQHIHEISLLNGWHDADLTAAGGGPNVASGAGIASIFDTIQNVMRVSYIGADQHVHQLYLSNGWHDADLAAITGATNAASGAGIANAIDTSQNVLRIHYVGADQHIHEIYLLNGWHHWDLTASAGGPNAATGTIVASIFDTVQNVMRTNYVGADLHLHQLYTSGGWHDFDLTAATGAPNAAAGAGIANLIDTSNSPTLLRINYIASDQHVHQLLISGGAWHDYDLTVAAGDMNAASASGIANVVDSIHNLMRIDFVGADHHAHELSVNTAWHDQDLTASAGSVGALPAGYVLCASDGQFCNFPGATKDVAYGANGTFRILANVHDLVFCSVNPFGDPAPGVSKACYMKDSGAGSTAGPGPSDYILCGAEGQTCSFSGQTMDFAYGTNDIFRLITKVSNSQLCSNTVFGDPMVGVQKACYIRPSSALPSGPPVGYLWCADEYANCVSSSPQTVAFGANGSFIYQLNVNGTVSCTSSNFGGDPAPGVAKNCYSAPYGAETGQDFSGSLNTLQLPTGGAIQWAYGSYSFPAQSAGVRPARSKNAGVVTRVVLDQTGAHTWTYQSHVTGPVNPPPGEVVNTVTDPLGNVTKRYFSVSLVDNPSGNGIYDYGRQYTPNSNTPNSTLGNLFLSEEYFDSLGNLVYRKYVRFERDQVVPPGALPDAGNDNGRMAQQTTVYADSTQVGHTDSDFDGVGHYRFRQTYGTGFESAGQPDSAVRNIVTHYNPSLATYSAPNNNPPSGYQPPSASGPWVLITLDYTSTADNTTTFKQSFVYDTNTGFLCAQRIFAGTGGNDLFRLFIPDGNGNVATEADFGGDREPASQSFSLGCQSPAQGAEYIVNHTYQNGALRFTQYRGAGFLSVDRTIDLNTGLPQSSRDTAGIQTNFQYDVLGRLTFIKPRDTAWTAYNYVGAIAGSTQPTLTIQQFPNANLSSPPLTFARHYFDLLGRVQATDLHMANGTSSTRAFTYDALGRRFSISELGATTQATRFTYDPLGRVSSVTGPDGKTTSYQYSGIQQVTRSYSVAGAGVVSSKEKFDRFGQLVEVDQPSGARGAVVATRYTYNAGGRMTQASTIGAEGQQTRTFRYDGRGFLLSQTQPEITAISPSGNSVDFGHDSRGHLVTQMFGNGEAYSYWYDLAERLTNVCLGSQQCGTPLAPCPNTSLTCLKEFSYDQGVNGMGKVYQASRFNHPVLGTTQHFSKITYTYTYTGANGWISARNLFHTFDGQTGSSQEAFNQSFVWNQLGYLDNETYPNCAPSFAPCSGSSTPPPSRTVSYAYTNGMLTDVTGYTLGPPGITYNPNGTINQVTHANGVVTTYAMDPNNMPRVFSIAASGPGGVPLWNSGNYAYDGQGNISAMGNSSFTYDGVSRVLTAYMQTDPNVNSSAFAASSQYFCYDSFGNLLGIQGASDCTSPDLPTYSSSNQLQAAAYNTRGNLIQWNGASYSYEGDQSKLQHFQSGQEQWFFMYDADDERVWQVGLGIPGLSGLLARWSLRGLDGKVRREFNVPSYQWGTWNTPPTMGGAVSWWRDLIYRGNAAMADILSNGYQRHLDVDHLGSVRLTTNSSGTQDGYHIYFPFGQEAITGGEVPAERIKLAGSERYLGEAGTNFLLDYMHARDTSPNLGRFLTPDVGGPNLRNPLTWNGYSYVLNNPVNLVDPGGLDDVSSQPCDVGGDNGTCDQQPASSNDPYDLSGIPPDLIAEALAGNTDDTIIVVDDTITVTARDPGPNAADVLSQGRDWLEGLIHSGKDLLQYLVTKPWVLSVIVPLAPEPELGVGPAGSLAYDPQSHTLCAGVGVGAGAGHNAAVGPLLAGHSFSSTPWPQNAPELLSGWSVGLGFNTAFPPGAGIGGQLVFNSSGVAVGPTAGVPGGSVAVTYSGCLNF
ncbi:MAG TPA: RHS repeat-associated core domain-containing protein [Candidatus Angelobacter sp.]